MGVVYIKVSVGHEFSKRIEGDELEGDKAHSKPSHSIKHV